MVIRKERPLGSINGSNKIFSTLFDVSRIDDIWIDGEIYYGTFTVEGKVITLNAAPTTSIYVDYYADIITD